MRDVRGVLLEQTAINKKLMMLLRQGNVQMYVVTEGNGTRTR